MMDLLVFLKVGLGQVVLIILVIIIILTISRIMRDRR